MVIQVRSQIFSDMSKLQMKKPDWREIKERLREKVEGLQIKARLKNLVQRIKDFQIKKKLKGAFQAIRRKSRDLDLKGRIERIDGQEIKDKLNVFQKYKDKKTEARLTYLQGEFGDPIDKGTEQDSTLTSVQKEGLENPSSEMRKDSDKPSWQTIDTFQSIQRKKRDVSPEHDLTIKQYWNQQFRALLKYHFNHQEHQDLVKFFRHDMNNRFPILLRLLEKVEELKDIWIYKRTRKTKKELLDFLDHT